MRKTLAVMALAASTLTLAAGPGNSDNTQGRQGNNACYGIQGVGGQEFKNPGEMWRHIRDEHGMSPEEWIQNRQAETVSEFIYNRCVVHNPDA